MNRKVIVVAGGTGGIGSGIVKGLVSESTKVYFTYNSASSAARELENSLGKDAVEGIQCNVTDMAQVSSVIEAIDEKEDGQIDVLINAFGITKDKPFLMMDESDWKEVIDINLNGIFNMTRRVGFIMYKNKSGIILNLSSVSGIYGLPGQSNYSASKAAIIGFSKAIARELSPKGIRVNTIAPGFIRTAMTDKLPEKYLDEMKKKILLGRLGEVEDLIGLIQFLISEKASYITNQVFVVDGGMF